MMRPLVTAILPVFNRSGSVIRAIESVFEQRISDLELIIVDDGSTDGTAAVLERYRNRALILAQPNRGAYAARNLALRHARGEFIAFIDSDDAWLPSRLERQVPLMRAGVGLVYGDTEIIRRPASDAPRSGLTGFRTISPVRGRVLEHFIWGNFVATSAALVRRSALEEIGGFAETSRLSSDFLAWFRIAQTHEFDYVDAPVAHYTQHPAGISADLGRSLSARISLFTGERERTDDPEVRSIIDRLLFNLGLHLAVATARGQAKSVQRPLRLARKAAAGIDKRRALLSIAAFTMRHLSLRARRLLP